MTNEFEKYHEFVKDIAWLLNDKPEHLMLSIDIWGHWDAVYPVFRLYAKPDELLFTGKSLQEIKDQAYNMGRSGGIIR